MRTIADTLEMLRVPDYIEKLPAPPYLPPREDPRVCVGLAVGNMRDHMTDEGWQIFEGLQYNGYYLAGYRTPNPETYVPDIMEKLNPGTVLVQDKREWEGLTAGRTKDPKLFFNNIQRLAQRPDVFKLTILKDAQNSPEYHRESAREMGCHAWVVYYHPRIVAHIAPYLRKEHIIRTYHTIEGAQTFGVLGDEVSKSERMACVLTGAISGAYPMRQKVQRYIFEGELPNVDYIKHPGYHQRGTDTLKYRELLAKYRVSICTSSAYGYLLRKIIESTASGCIVISDLPTDEVVPEIDGNIIRVDPRISAADLRVLIGTLANDYCIKKQTKYAEAAIDYFNHIRITEKLKKDIETMRLNYNKEKR